MAFIYLYLAQPDSSCLPLEPGMHIYTAIIHPYPYKPRRFLSMRSYFERVSVQSGNWPQLLFPSDIFIATGWIQVSAPARYPIDWFRFRHVHFPDGETNVLMVHSVYLIPFIVRNNCTPSCVTAAPRMNNTHPTPMRIGPKGARVVGEINRGWWTFDTISTRFYNFQQEQTFLGHLHVNHWQLYLSFTFLVAIFRAVLPISFQHNANYDINFFEPIDPFIFVCTI